MPKVINSLVVVNSEHNINNAGDTTQAISGGDSACDQNNIVIVQSSNGISLNRHNSMGSPKTIGLKDTRLTLGRAESEKIGRIQLDQLKPSQPLPKPRKIVNLPVATLDLDDLQPQVSNSNHSGIGLFRRSKTTLDSFATRAHHVTTISTGNNNYNNNSNNTSNASSFFSGKTVELKNNLKNAAERLFSEIIASQQKQTAMPVTMITKHEPAIQHQALLEQELLMERQKRLIEQQQQQQLQEQLPSRTTTPQNVTVVKTTTATTPTKTASVTTTPSKNTMNNCTRININSNANNNDHNEQSSPTTKSIKSMKSLQIESILNSPEKKAAFHEMLISELAAMRGKSNSLDNLRKPDANLTVLANQSSHSTPAAKKPNVCAMQAKKMISTKARERHNSLDDPDPDIEDVDADNIEDADGDEDDLTKTLKVVAKNSPRKRCPSGCSSDSSPYGTERSSRIRTSDWIEVGDNGKQVTLTSCHISLEDSGLEDEERLDDMSSSGVGDSWDSVKEAANEKRCRNAKRVMSIPGLPPLPKSLSGFNKMLGSDSGLISDADPNLENHSNNNNNNSSNSSNNNKNNMRKLENQKDTSNNNGSTESSVQENNAIDETLKSEMNGNDSDLVANGTETPASSNNTTTTITTETGCTLDKQLAILKKEMQSLRQLDLSLLSQLWTLNESIQEFRTILQEQDQDEDSYSSQSRTPSSYESVSSEEEDNVNRSQKQAAIKPKIITTQPKLNNSHSFDEQNNMQSTDEMENEIAITTPTTSKVMTAVTTGTALHSSTKSALNVPVAQPRSPGQKNHQIIPEMLHVDKTQYQQLYQQQQQQQQKPPLPKPLEMRPVPRMRSAPPPPPVVRSKVAAPPRPT